MADLFKVKPIAAALMSEYGLSSDWTVTYDLKELRKFGACNSVEQRIRLNPLLITTNSLERVIQVVKHEIAHAVVGSWNQHGELWIQQMQSMGEPPIPCFQFGSHDVIKPASLWTANCRCGKVYELPRISTKRWYRCSNPSCRLPLTFAQNKTRKQQLKAAALGISYVEDLGF